MPKVSVITTLYNCESFVKQSLISIFNQTYSDIEYVICDDGSTDNTRKICTEIISNYKDKNIIFEAYDDNKKIPYRRNQLISISSGEYISIHDGDDVSYPERIESQIRYLENNKDIFCIGGYARKINENDEYISDMNYLPIGNNNIVKYIYKNKLNPIIDPTSMFRKSVFDLLGGYSLDQKIYTVPDFYLWTKALMSDYKIDNIPVYCIKYRINKKGMTCLHKNEMDKAHTLVLRNFFNNFKWRLNG